MEETQEILKLLRENNEMLKEYDYSWRINGFNEEVIK